MIWFRTVFGLIAVGIMMAGMTACGCLTSCNDNTAAPEGSSPKEVKAPAPALKQSPGTEAGMEAAGQKPMISGQASPSKPTMNDSAGTKPVGQNVPPSKQTTKPGMILKNADRYESLIVTVSGVFHGWRGPCAYGPPVSRGDWMIADDSGCLYVHGPVPAGLDPARPAGEQIAVTGVVRLKNGSPYLEAGR